MCSFIVVYLILITIVSSTAAKPFSAESDPYLETAVLNPADDENLDYQLFDGQQFSDQLLPPNQDGAADAINTNDIKPDTLASQDLSGLDGPYLQAFLDEPPSPIDSKNGVYGAAACDTPTGADFSSSSNPLRAKDLNDIFKLTLPDLETNPSCTNPTLQLPKPQPEPQPEWVPLLPVIHPVNAERCPVELDGIQPIALCCYEEDFGELGERIAVARGCYTCRFRIHCRSEHVLIRIVTHRYGSTRP